MFLLIAHHPESRGAHGVSNVDDLLSSEVPDILQHAGQVILAHLVPAELPESLLTQCCPVKLLIKAGSPYFVRVEIGVVPAVEVSPEVSQPNIKPRFSQEES